MTPSAPAAQILHGVFLRVFDVGVLLSGESGVGKSELALELLARGHRLIVDDAVQFDPAGENGAAIAIGRCPPLLRGFLEVRGLGVLNIERMFGDAALIERSRLDLVLRLQNAGEVGEAPDRIWGQRRHCRVAGAEVPEIALPIRVGHNLAALAEAACRDRLLKRGGYDAAADFVERQRRMLGAGPDGPDEPRRGSRA